MQRHFLALLTEAAENGDVPKTQIAFLTDRIRFNEGKSQIYGTVLDWNEKGELFCEVEDPANLDAKREEVGLAPLHEDLEKHREEVESEGGRPPKNFTEYKQKARDWARSVGWI